MTLYRADWNWFGVVAGLWLGVLVLVSAPASWWMQVNSVKVLDSTAGIPPSMIVERTINRAFQANWTVTVVRQGQRGFSAFCTATGANDYRPDAVLPDNLDLDWWTWPTQCPLPAGRYKVRTLWVLHLPLFPDKEVRATSNVFEVR